MAKNVNFDDVSKLLSVSEAARKHGSAFMNIAKAAEDKLREIDADLKPEQPTLRPEQSGMPTSMPASGPQPTQEQPTERNLPVRPIEPPRYPQVDRPRPDFTPTRSVDRPGVVSDETLPRPGDN